MTNFVHQCKPVINNSVLPILSFLTDKRMDDVTLENDEIISLIRKINPNKATGSDGISDQMSLFVERFSKRLCSIISTLTFIQTIL